LEVELFSLCTTDQSCGDTVYYDSKSCDVDQYCNLEIPTRAQHVEQSENTFYVRVSGNRAQYTITFTAGLDNCEIPTLSDGAFCDASLLNYTVWSWRNFDDLDAQAECFYNQLYDLFYYSRDYPCVTNCTDALKWYACYSTFRACDSDGFYVATCQVACDAVAFYCGNSFDTVGAQDLNCTSSIYLDESTDFCTGSAIQIDYPPNTFDNIIGPTVSESSSSSLRPTLVLVALAFILSLLAL